MSMLGLPLEDTEAVRSFRDKAGAGELEPLRNYLQKEMQISSRQFYQVILRVQVLSYLSFLF